MKDSAQLPLICLQRGEQRNRDYKRWSNWRCLQLVGAHRVESWSPTFRCWCCWKGVWQAAETTIIPGPSAQLHIFSGLWPHYSNCRCWCSTVTLSPNQVTLVLVCSTIRGHVFYFKSTLLTHKPPWIFLCVLRPCRSVNTDTSGRGEKAQTASSSLLAISTINVTACESKVLLKVTAFLLVKTCFNYLYCAQSLNVKLFSKLPLSWRVTCNNCRIKV